MTDLRGQLTAIYERRGELTPQAVVDEARPPSHPLHTRFEWDDSIAGERYRRHQAQELIRSVKIRKGDVTGVPSDNDDTVRGYQAVRRSDGWRYEPTEQVARDPIASQLVLQEMEREWKALYQRYNHFVEFIDMVRADLLK